MIHIPLAVIDSAESLAEAFRLSLFGDTVIQAGLLISIVAFVLCGIGMLRKDERFVHAARQSQYLVFLTAAVGCGIIWHMLFDGLFVSNYVQRISENQEEFFFKVVGLWASQEGSVLFWCLVLSFVGVVFAFANRHTRTDRRLPATLLVLFGIEIFFYSLMLSDSTSPFTLGIEWMNNPEWTDMTVAQFAEYWDKAGQLRGLGTGAADIVSSAYDGVVDQYGGLVARIQGGHATASWTLGELYQNLVHYPHRLTETISNAAVSSFSDGQGMNPQLHNYWIAIHPPTLYLGYIGFTIPFCYAVGSLISGELGTEWIRKARVWTMTAWVFLTAGIAMGGLWAYEILGWGGYWAWDPVENASFIPWLTATAFIHSVIVQERRGMLKSWNVLLIILTYCMTIIGTFLVRAGIVESVHAFGDTGLKWPLIGFMAVVFLGSILLVVWRLPLLKADRRMETVVSREGIFLLNNLVLVLIALITLVMTLWPALSELLGGTKSKHTFGETAYTMINAPLFLLLLLLTGIGPLLSYGRAPIRQVLNQLAWPIAISGLVAAVNVIRIHGLDIAKPIPDDGDLLGTGVAIVRRTIQYTLFPIVALVLASVTQEMWQASGLRQRITGGSRIGAAFGAVLANRRRFGGYIAHIGMAMIAVGIYLSSLYETDTSAMLKRGQYTVVGTGDSQWAVINDLFSPSPLYRGLTADGGRRDPAAQKVLFAARALRIEPGLADDELRKRTFVGTHFPEKVNLEPVFRNAILSMQAEPDMSVEQLMDRILKDAPMLKDNQAAQGRMQAGLARSRGLLTLTDDDIRVAREMAASTRSFEYYQSTVRLLPSQPRPMQEAEAKEFLSAYRTAYDAVSAKGPTADELSAVVALAFRFGPDLLPLLSAIEGSLTQDVASHRGFQRIILQRMHEREVDVVQTHLITLSDASFDTNAKAQAEVELDRLGWRALGGLRAVEANGSEAASQLARERIAAILASSHTVRPRIQNFFDKRTGEPRSAGESVRDPEILRRLEEDVYLILQGVEIPDQADQSQDIAIFRIFIKPGMNIGILGLVVIVLGSVFALLPRRRRADSLPSPGELPRSRNQEGDLSP